MLSSFILIFVCFFFHGPATTGIYTFSLHDALPISEARGGATLAPHEDRGERRGADAALRQGRCPRLRAALPPPSSPLVPVPAATGRQCGHGRGIVPGPLDARRQFPRAL